MTDHADFTRFVFDEPDADVVYYTHRTDDATTADEIMKKGLYFSDSFQKTTDLLLNDAIHLRYWQNLRKEYGAYTVIIGISRQLLENYQALLNSITQTNYEVQQVLTENDPFSDEELDEVFTVPVKFIKGYWDGHKSEAHSNPQYDPFFESPVFKRNIDNLIQNEKKKS